MNGFNTHTKICMPVVPITPLNYDNIHTERIPETIACNTHANTVDCIYRNPRIRNAHKLYTQTYCTFAVEAWGQW